MWPGDGRKIEGVRICALCGELLRTCRISQLQATDRRCVTHEGFDIVSGGWACLFGRLEIRVLRHQYTGEFLSNADPRMTKA